MVRKEEESVVFNEHFEEAVQKAMKELGISRKSAIAELTVFMCGHGTIEDFRNYINYLIKEPKRICQK